MSWRHATDSDVLLACTSSEGNATPGNLQDLDVHKGPSTSTNPRIFWHWTPSPLQKQYFRVINDQDALRTPVNQINWNRFCYSMFTIVDNLEINIQRNTRNKTYPKTQLVVVLVCGLAQSIVPCRAPPQSPLQDIKFALDLPPTRPAFKCTALRHSFANVYIYDIGATTMFLDGPRLLFSSVKDSCWFVLAKMLLVANNWHFLIFGIAQLIENPCSFECSPRLPYSVRIKALFC